MLILIKVNKDIIENLAQAIRELSENPEKRMALSEAAKKESMNWTKENYYKNFIREFINWYLEKYNEAYNNFNCSI